MDVTSFINTLDGLLSREDFGGAKEYLYSSLDESVRENNILSAISVYNEIMGFERQYGDNAAAVKAACAAIKLLEDAEMSVSRPAAMIYLNSATVYKNAGFPKRAKELYETAEKLFLRFYNSGDREFAGLYNNMASVYLTPEGYMKAEYYYTRALSILKRHGDICDTAVTYFNLACLCNMRGNKNESLDYAESGFAVMDIPEASRDSYYFYTCRKCAAAAKELGFDLMYADFTERARNYYEGH